MGTKYSSQSISGYNSSPPSDDGTQSEANKVKWSTIKSKLADTLKTFAENINTAIANALDYSTNTQATDYTTVAGDHDKVIQVTASATITALLAATAGAGYRFGVSNQHSASITVARSGSDTFPGAATSYTVVAGQTVWFYVNAAGNGYLVETAATGTGAPVRANTPTLITPVIGAATGTSLALTGALACDGNATLGNATSDVHTLTGQLKATTTNLRHELNSDYNGAFVLLVKNTDGTSPNGTFMQYSAVAPNGTGNQFWRAEDSSTVRGELRSNGGFANYSANNVNLSTRAVKNSITTYSEATLLKYEAFLEDVDWGTWKYNDQTHEDLNHGPTVEGVRNALKNHNLTLEEGSLIDVFDNDTLGLVTEDLKNIALASLIASNKRLRERVAAIEARI